MVNRLSAVLLLASKIEPQVRSRLLLVLLGIVILGLTMFVVVRLSSSYIRRRLRAPNRASRIGPHYWAARHLRPHARHKADDQPN